LTDGCSHKNVDPKTRTCKKCGRIVKELEHTDD
jgi:hypothetical protein